MSMPSSSRWRWTSWRGSWARPDPGRPPRGHGSRWERRWRPSRLRGVSPGPDVEMATQRRAPALPGAEVFCARARKPSCTPPRDDPGGPGFAAKPRPVLPVIRPVIRPMIGPGSLPVSRRNLRGGGGDGRRGRWRVSPRNLATAPPASPDAAGRSCRWGTRLRGDLPCCGRAGGMVSPRNLSRPPRPPELTRRQVRPGRPCRSRPRFRARLRPRPRH